MQLYKNVPVYNHACSCIELHFVYTDPPVTEEYQKLKATLEVFNSTLHVESASVQNVELSTINCMRAVIQQYIERALRLGEETSKVKSDMEKLCRSDLVIPTALWRWTMQEVEKTHEKLTSEQRKVAKPIVKEAEPAPSLFSKDTLYHACLCCDALSDPNPANPLSYFRNKNPHHRIKEVSFSQNRDGITPYLIAKQGDMIYVAFQSTPLLSKWKEIASSFNEGFCLSHKCMHTCTHMCIHTILLLYYRIEAAKQSNSTSFFHG